MAEPRVFELAEPAFRYALREAIEDGRILPCPICKAMTVKTAAGDGFPVRRDELDWSVMDRKARAEIQYLFARQDTIAADPKALERTNTIPKRNRAIAREFRDAHEKGFTGRDGVQPSPAWGKTIVLAATPATCGDAGGVVRRACRRPEAEPGDTVRRFRSEQSAFCT